MAAVERLALLIQSDVKGAVAGLNNVGKAVDRNLAPSKLDKFGGALSKAGTGMVGFGVAALVGLGKAAQASEEAQIAVVKLQNSLANNPRLAGESAQSFIDLADAIQDKTAADADSIVAGLAVITQSKLQADQIRTLTPLIVDFARKKGIDEVTAFQTATKAAEGNVGILKRSGIAVDENLAKTDAYTATVDALRDSVGGFAEQEGNTFSGKLERLKNQMGDLAEGVGSGAVDAFSSMFDAITPVVDRFNELDPAVQGAVGKVAAFGGVAAVTVGATSTLVGQAIKARDNFKSLGDGVASLKGKLSANLVPAVAGVTAAIGLGLIAYQAYARKKAEARRVTDGFVAALRSESGEFGQNTREFIANEIATKGYASTLREAGVPLDDFVSGVANSGDKLEAFADQIHLQANGPLLDVQVALKEAGLTGTEFGDRLAAASENLSKQQFMYLVNDLDALSDGFDRAGGEVENFESAGGKVSSSFDDVSDSADEATEAVKSYNDQLRAVHDPIFGVINAQDRLNESQFRLAEAEREHGRGSAEYAAALVDSAEAAFDLDGAVSDLQVAVANDPGLYSKAKGALSGYKDQFGLTSEAAGFTAGKIDAVAKAVGRLPKKTELAITADAQQAINELARLYAVAGAYNIQLDEGFFGAANLSGTVTHKAGGGLVRGGQSYMVGEFGPERLTLGGGAVGTITPNGGSSGPVASFVNYGVVTTSDVDAWFADVQERARRRGYIR